MANRRIFIATTMLFLMSVSGCARPPCCPSPVYEPGVPRVEHSHWGETSRSTMTMPDTAIPPYADALEAVPSRLTNQLYRALPAIETQCRAAEYAPLANLILSEADAVSAGAACDPDGACSEPLMRDLLELRAVDERNKAARNALTVFYRLAEAETALQGIERGLPILDRALEDARRIREQGLTQPADPAVLQRQRLTMLSQREDAQLAILQLNEQLGQLLGVDRPEVVRFWPQTDWSLSVEPLDLGTQISIGMMQRADLAMLRRAQGGLSPATVSAARQVLSLTNVALGQSSPVPMMLFSHQARCACAACEELVRSDQLAELTAQQEESAASEIRQAAYVVEARTRQAALAADELKSFRDQLENTRTLRRADQATAFDVYAAETDVIQAETDLARAIIAVRIAEVDLQAAQGLLAADCGY